VLLPALDPDDINQSMSSLLELPREVRDQIIILVLHSSRPLGDLPVPSSQVKSNMDTPVAGRTWVRHLQTKAPYSRRDYVLTGEYLEDTATLKSPAYGLLQTCMQLRNETLQNKANLQLPSAAVDLILADHLRFWSDTVTIWPTWIRAPILPAPKTIEALDVNIRLYQYYKTDVDDYPWKKALKRFFLRFLTVGPAADIPSDEWQHLAPCEPEWPILKYNPRKVIGELRINIDAKFVPTELDSAHAIFEQVPLYTTGLWVFAQDYMVEMIRHWLRFQWPSIADSEDLVQDGDAYDGGKDVEAIKNDIHLFMLLRVGRIFLTFGDNDEWVWDVEQILQPRSVDEESERNFKKSVLQARKEIWGTVE
jgi:hypothetical protein